MPAAVLVPYARQPALEPVELALGPCPAGPVGLSLRRIARNWLFPFPEANPAMLQMLRDRDRRPTRTLMPWSGEFVGKYLVGALQIADLVDSPELNECVVSLCRALIATQGGDGYLGPFPAHARLTGENWDVWGHYHAILALLAAEDRSVPGALEAAARAADLICDTFGPGRARLTCDGAMGQSNLAISHGLALLYRRTGQAGYLETALWAADDADLEGGPQFMAGVAQGREFFQFTGRRWELLHTFQGLAELYWITGQERFREAFTHIWDSIRRLDRHNTGGFSTGEAAVGSPYAQGAIETCCTVAWICLSVEMLRMTGDPRVADELELSLYNGMLGSMHPSARWWTYSTPMDGVRRSASDEIVFQAHPGGPELNCCNAHAPRGIGELRNWGLMRAHDGPVVNFYGAGRSHAQIGGQSLTIIQTTDYPLTGAIHLTVETEAPMEFTLRLRIPGWARAARLECNGRPVEITPGAYAAVRRTWTTGDRLHLELDMGLRYWAGRDECAGKVSLYRGPILLAYDQRLNNFDPDELPTVDALQAGASRLPASSGPSAPMLQVELACLDGRSIALCDFASAGAAGNPYISWLPAANANPACDGPSL